MRDRRTTLFLACCALIACAGCARGYKTVGLHEVRAVQTREGLAAQIVEEPFPAFREVIERSPNVTSVTRMTDLRGKQEPSHFAISPSNDWLVFQAKEKMGSDDYLNLWRISTTGSAGLTRLTAGRYLDMEPAFSPDGKSVCFASNRSSLLTKLWRVEVDGAGGIARITNAESEDRWPNVSPDGRRVFYSSKPFDTVAWQIWMINSNGVLPTQLKEGRWPKTSPDGKRVLYCAYDSEIDRWKIWVMDVDGSNQTQLTDGGESDEWNPSWSPDGSKIVYTSDIGRDSNRKSNFDIWVMEADGSNVTQLTTNGSTDLMPVYGPNGSFIYFLSNRGFYWDIWRMEMVDAAKWGWTRFIDD